ncbi:MAG: hypothetical protein HZA08_04315 [Nitrospirae bacterium]|nr:hypothetical protein [Nitrospirota bacterium]
MDYKKRIWKYGLILLVFFGTVIKVHAGEFPTLYKGIRPLGMGNAFTTVSDDENALFYNPAGLNDVQGFGGIEILNPTIELSQTGLDVSKDFKDINTDNVTEVTDLLGKYIGKQFSLRTSVFPNIIFHNFGLGVLGQGSVSGEIRNRVNPNVAVDLKTDVGGVVGFAHGFWDQKLQAGIAIKFIQRNRFQQTYYAIDIADAKFDPTADFNDNKKTGSGITGDIGLKFNPSLPLRPTLGAVLQNVGDLNLKDAGKLPHQLNVGISVHPDFWIFRNTLALDMVDVTKNIKEEKDTYKRIHMGAEIKLPYILSFRVGSNQGYTTYGATVDLWLVKVAYAYYKEELGAYAGQKEDARHVIQAAIGF